MIVDLGAVKILNAEKRREAARASAEKVKAQQDADAANGWAIFTERHAGPKAVRDGIVFFDCTANREMIELLLYEEEMAVNAQTIEWGWSECRNRLAVAPKTPYQRKTNVAESRIAPQQRSFAPAGKVAPYTRAEILSFSPSQLRAALRKYTAAELNRILSSN